MPKSCADSLPQFSTTLQIHSARDREAKIPPPLPGQQLLEEESTQNQKKLLIQVGSTTVIHLGKYFWQVISKSLYFSVPGPLLAIVVV